MTVSQLHYYRPDWIERTDETVMTDVCIYGGSAAGVIAASVLADSGVDVLLVHPGRWLGGMTTGGLGFTDHGDKHAIGGRSGDFYQRMGRLHGREELWKFDPHTARQALDAIVAASRLPVRLAGYLDRVVTDGRLITEAHMLGGLRVRAKLWIDAGYEGDLLAAAGVPFTVGREGNARYGEQANGVQVLGKHQFTPAGVAPFIVAGNPASGLLPGIETVDLRQRIGQGDHKVQAYCFRVCMTDDPELKIDWQKPAGYDPLEHELAVRWFAQADKHPYNEHLPDGADKPQKFDVLAIPTPGGFHKTDTNNHGPVSSDYIGASHHWALADHALRERIFQAHVRYQQGFYWTIANDPRVPDRYRRAYQRWGLPRDEYAETGHWPHQLYVREARRMVSDVVLTEHVCRNRQPIDDPIGLGSYTLDSHNCSRFIGADGFVHNEGDVQLSIERPYPISYRCVIPPAGSCENLLAPVCFSASHIAYGSARMEPVFMLLAESCALAARLALENSSAVQAVDYSTLRQRLEDAGQAVSL